MNGAEFRKSECRREEGRKEGRKEGEGIKTRATGKFNLQGHRIELTHGRFHYL